MRFIATDGRTWSVCGPSDGTTMSLAKTDEPIEMALIGGKLAWE